MEIESVLLRSGHVTEGQPTTKRAAPSPAVSLPTSGNGLRIVEYPAHEDLLLWPDPECPQAECPQEVSFKTNERPKWKERSPAVILAMILPSFCIFLLLLFLLFCSVSLYSTWKQCSAPALPIIHVLLGPHSSTYPPIFIPIVHDINNLYYEPGAWLR
ncbi:hypothetical protein KQX54_005643 [Cotesia glomerata]|uniref:Uncharacterized protein n=1 Tax=Cotesia glomerata TaxID=32391 RepID=A0AAV7I9C9_COTGL|nr:hypothetical protein KQX54_005643 [Cotesia glomerata]